MCVCVCVLGGVRLGDPPAPPQYRRPCQCKLIFSYLCFIIFQILLLDLRPTCGSWPKWQIIRIAQWRIVNYRNDLSLHIHTYHPVWQNLKTAYIRIMQWEIVFNKIWLMTNCICVGIITEYLRKHDHRIRKRSSRLHSWIVTWIMLV